MNRKCPFRGCNSSLPDSVFACRQHWRHLTPYQRKQVSDAYAAYLADRISVEELRRVQRGALDACQGVG